MKALPEYYDSQEKAFIIDDYPCGFTARCQKMVWIESSEKHGMRLCSRTTNKYGKWCAPKKETYCSLIRLGIDETTGHLTHESLNTAYGENEKSLAWLNENKSYFMQHEIYKNLFLIAYRIVLARKHLESSKEGKNLYDYDGPTRSKLLFDAMCNAQKEMEELNM